MSYTSEIDFTSRFTLSIICSYSRTGLFLW